MARVIFEQPGMDTKEVEIKTGHTILRAARQGRVPLKHRCGGRAQCTTCKVTIDDQSAISEPADVEKIMLGERNIEKGMRLSCQTRVFGTVRVLMPEDPYRARIQALLKQQRENS